MTEIPTFPVLRLLTDEEVERALNRTYSLQEGPDQHDYLRSDRLIRIADCDVGLCFFGEAFGMGYSPGTHEVAERLADRTDRDFKDVSMLVKAFIQANDLYPHTDTITDDAMLRAVVAASRAES